MLKVDYIIVGLGIAGIGLCEQLQKHNHSFLVVDNGAPGATAKSGGVFNPTVLKRFTAAWNAAGFYPAAVGFYTTLSEKLAVKFFADTPIFRIFKSVEEQNNWSVASDKKELRHFLSSEYVKNDNPAINAPLGFGKVLATAQIHTDSLLSAYRKFLDGSRALLTEDFQYKELKQHDTGIVYKNISAKRIIFAEGANAVNNPFFPTTTLIGNKGEYVIVRAPELKLETFLKGPVYVIPLGNDCYKVGASYSRDNFSTHTTDSAKDEMLTKLRSMINCRFELVGQTAGVRPTTKDHRPLLGNVEGAPNIFFLNGLGSRGFLMAPLLAEMLHGYMELNKPLPAAVDINRMLK